LCTYLQSHIKIKEDAMFRNRLVAFAFAFGGLIAVILVLILAIQVGPAASQSSDDGESRLVDEGENDAVDEVENLDQFSPEYFGGSYPLFASNDTTTIPAVQIDVSSSDFITAFVGWDGWGAAYDPAGDKVYHNNGSSLYEWPVGGTPVLLGTITVSGGATLTVHGLAFYEGNLYATSISTDQIYTIDLTTYLATSIISLVDTSASISGLAIDQATGDIYGTDDGTNDALVKINNDGTLTVVAAYLAGETDVDGLAISNSGQAYLITDDNTPPYFNVYDLNLMTYTGVISYPWTANANQVGGAWIERGGPPLSCNGPTTGFEEGVFPKDWYWTTQALPGGEWVVSMDNSSGFWDPGIPPEGAYYASANDDLPGSGSDGSADYLYTNIIDLSGFNNASMNFWYHFNGAFGHVAGGVEVSGDGGATWDGEIILETGDDWQSYVLNLDAYTGNSNVQVRFHSNDDGAWAAGYAIDAVFLRCATVPDIEVDPSSLESKQELGSKATLPITISNVGLENLDWVILEEAAPERPEYVAGLYAPSALAAPMDGVAVATSGTGGYNPLGSMVRSWNSQNGPYFTIFDLATPDTLPNIAAFLAGGNFVGAGEFVNGLSYMVDVANNVYQVDDTGTILNQYSATAPPGTETYAGMALDPTTGVVYASSTDVFTSSLLKMDVDTGDATVIGHVTGSPGLIAIAIDGSGNMFGYDLVTDSFMQIDKATGATSNAVPLPFDANFGQGMGYDPSTGLLYILGFNNGTFQAELWTVNTFNPAAPIFSFVDLLGSVVPTGLNQLTWGGTEISLPDFCEPVDIPWASADPTSGTTPVGSSSVVDVTFDATGLVTGVYTGTLCIHSNDPVDPVVRVPLVMTVTLDYTYLPFVTNGSSTSANQESTSTAPLIGLVILPLATDLLPLRNRRRN
jgi:hypothetical protein